jgi:hypothetical protein
MRKLICFLVITTALFIIALGSFAANGQELNLDGYKNNIIDNRKFISFKDEEGQVKIFKTLASLRFDKGKIEFEIGKFIPTHKKETKIQDYRAYLEQSINADDHYRLQK